MLSENIKKLRKNKKLTQKQLASMCDISTSYIQQLELGQKENPSMEILSSLADALDVSRDELISDTKPISFAHTSRAAEDFIYDEPMTLAIVQFLWNHGYNTEYNESLKEVTILSNTDGSKLATVKETDLVTFDTTLLKLLEYSGAVADKFINDITAQYKD